jgi:membrane protein
MAEIRRVTSTIDYLPVNRYKQVFRFIEELFNEFAEDNCWDKSATIAYYTAFSLAPTLVILIAITSVFYEKEAVSGEIYLQIRSIVGESAAETIQNLLKNASLATDISLGTIISGVTALIGATTVFSVLHASLNQIWQVYHTHDMGILVLLRQRLLAFIMLLAVGLLLIALIIFNTVTDFIYLHFLDFFDVPPPLLLRATHSVVSFGFIMLLFAMIFKILSDTALRWRDIWAGAALTAGLFTLGRQGISFYLSQSSISSIYGAAGSLAILLTWIYYSTVILLLGAEFIKIYLRYKGNTIEEKKKAFKIRILPPSIPNE